MRRVGVDARDRLRALLIDEPQARWLSIDPSSTSSGLALWYGRVLVGAWAARVTRDRRRACLSVERMDTQLRKAPVFGSLSLYAIEWPRVYATGARRIDPAGPLAVAAAAGMWIAHYRCGLATLLVEAATWKGQVPKIVMAERIMAAVDKKELALLGDLVRGCEDAIDAIGLGLWLADRLGD
jgi:hypothetical protein